MLLNYNDVRVGKTLVESFTFQHYDKIQRFLKEPSYPKLAQKFV